jgi:F-type H+-transporting ATPase subunit b
LRRRAGASVLLILLVCASVFAQEEKGETGHPDLIGWKWANFALLAVALGYLIKKNAGPFFAARSQQIQAGIADAQRLREDAEARARDMEQRLANIGLEVDALRRSARQEAEAEGERIRQEAMRELEKIRHYAEQEITSLTKSARFELRRYAAELSLRLAQEKVKTRMTPATQDALVQAFVEDLGREGVREQAAS